MVCLCATAWAQPASAPRPQIAVEVPGVIGSISGEELAEARAPQPAPELKLPPGRRDYDLRGDSRTLFEQVGRTLGFQTVFDRDYQPTGNVRFRVEQEDARSALRLLEAATDSFVTPMGEHVILVARDTAQKRQQYARMIAVAVPIPEGVTPQEIQEIANVVRSSMDIRRLMADPEKRLLLIRDTEGKVRTAQLLAEDLMRPRPQVEVDVELMTTTSDVATHYGLSLPASFPIVDFLGNGANLLGSPLPSAVSGFLTLGGGTTFIGIGLTSATLWATASRSITKTLDHAELLAMDGQAATLKVGTKYPVETNAYVGQVTGTGPVYTPPPTVQFQDLGLVLKITPHVHGMEEVTLDVEASFQLLSGTAASGLPIISDREYKGTVRMREGQAAILAGLMSATEARTAVGIMGLMNIPLIGKILSERTTDKARDDTLIVLRPHLTIPPPGILAVHEAWVGSETRPAEPL
jgi:general secretion pathway protein D